MLHSIYYSTKIVAFCIIVELCFQSKTLMFIKYIDDYVLILLLINLSFQIFAQDYFGYTPANNFVNFIDSDNFLPYIVLPYFAITIFRGYIFNTNVFFTSFKLFIGYLNIIMSWCASGCIATTICLFLIIITPFLIKIINFKRVFSGIVIMYIIIVFISGNQFLSDLTYRIFGKTVQGSRKWLWAMSVAFWRKKIWLGYGGGGTAASSYIQGIDWNSHNFILKILIWGGVLLLAIYLLAFVLIAWNNKDIKYDWLKTVWICIFFAMHITYMTEGQIGEAPQFMLLYLGYHIKDCVQYKEYIRENTSLIKIST